MLICVISSQSAFSQGKPLKKVRFATFTNYLEPGQNPELPLFPSLEAALKDPENAFAVTISSSDAQLPNVAKLKNLRYLFLDKTFKYDNYYLNKDSLSAFFKRLETLENLQYLSLYDSKLLDYTSGLKKINALQLFEFNAPSFDAFADKLRSKIEILIINDSKLFALPESIVRLKDLEQLEISSLNITTLPESISELGKLKVLKLMVGKMTKLPSGFGNFRNMKYLDLGGTLLLTEFPLAVCQIKPLRELYININEVKEIPEEIGNLTELRELHLNYAKKIKKLPESMSRLRNLEKIYISQATDLTTLGGLNAMDHNFDLLLNVSSFNKIKDELAANNRIATLGVSSLIQPYIVDKLKKDLPGKNIIKIDF